MVNWDPGSHSAISDLEVEDREVSDTLYYVDYPLESCDGSVTVATVRPETMLGDTAIAVHPDDDRYTRLVGETAILPIVGRRLKIIADPYVKPEFGTGALKITPGHDPNDFEIGRAHGLDEILGDRRGRPHDRGRGRALRGHDARWRRARRSSPRCARRARIARTEPYTHDVPYSQRSGERIEPLISLQWFMRMDELAAARDRGRHERPRAHPPRGPAGARLPRVDGEHPAVVHLAASSGGAIRSPSGTADRTRRTSASSRREGGGLGARPGRARHLVLEPAVAVRDARLARADRRAARVLPDRRALDGARHHLPVGRPHDHDGPRVHGRHPVRGRLRPLDHPGARRAPDVEVARHGDRPAGPDRRRPAARRCSRRAATSPPTAPTPSASACWRCPRRRTCASTRSTSPQGRQLANKLYNACRLVLLRVPEGVTLPAAAPAPATVEDALDPLAPAGAPRREVADAIEGFEFHRAALGLYDFVYGELCDWYLEMLKPRLYADDNAAAADVRAARAARDARARAPGDPVRHRGDLVPRARAPAGC